jgi:pyruvate dehydrogenase E2 component (dihydrolipoamide acetyltransferase)
MWKVEIPKTESKVEEATLAKWYKKEGDKVQKDELIAEIETFKALIEINSPHDGILYKIIVQEGDTVPVNTVIAIIAEEGETISEEDIDPFLQNKEEKEKKTDVIEKERTDSSKKDDTPTISKKKEKIKIAPVARKLASEKGIDISLISGSGPGGAITKKDVEEFLFQGKEEEDFNIKEVYQLTKVQQLSADRLTESYKNIPQFTLFRKINIGQAIEKRKEINSQSESHLSLIDFIIEALIPSFKKFPEFNAVSTKESYKYKLVKDINIGLAVATERGLMVPVLKNLAEKNIYEIAQLRIDTTQKALEGKLQPDDFNKGTFTITNLGLQGIEYFTPIINPPEVAILGIGKIDEQFLPISLTVDHRIIDGVKGTEFLNFLAKQLAFKREGGKQG